RGSAAAAWPFPHRCRSIHRGRSRRGQAIRDECSPRREAVAACETECNRILAPADRNRAALRTALARPTRGRSVHWGETLSSMQKSECRMQNENQMVFHSAFCTLHSAFQELFLYHSKGGRSMKTILGINGAAGRMG